MEKVRQDRTQMVPARMERPILKGNEESQQCISFRLARVGDCDALARLHVKCSMSQPQGFMYRLGPVFLRTYYRVLLAERNSLVICAEQEGRIVGFLSGSMKAEEHISAIRKSAVRLGLAAGLAILMHPSLAEDLFRRWQFVRGSAEAGELIEVSGVRQEYWAWNAEARLGGGALALNRVWKQVAEAFGAKVVRLEVDRANLKVLRLQLALGAREARSFTTLDGRERVVLEYVLPYRTNHRSQLGQSPEAD